LFWFSATVDKIYDGPVRNAGIGLQSDLAGAAVGISHLDALFLYPGAQFAQGIGIQFRMGHTLVAGEATASDTLRNQDV